MIKCPCKDCERKGCGPYHDVCEPYQDYCKNRTLNRKDIKRKYEGITNMKTYKHILNIDARILRKYN